MTKNIFFLTGSIALFFAYVICARNVIIFNNCPNPVHVRQIFQVNPERVEDFKLEKTIYLKAGQAAFVKDYKKNYLYYYLEGISKNSVREFNCMFPTKYQKYEFGINKEKRNLFIVLYQSAKQHGGLGIGNLKTKISYSIKRGVHIYDLYSEKAFTKSKLLKVLRGFGKGEKYADEVIETLKTENDLEKEKILEYVESAKRSMEEYTDEREQLLLFGEERLSKEIWQKVRELEAGKQDYYSQEGKVDGGLIRELLNGEFYGSILDNISLLVGKYHALKIMAQKRMEFLEKEKKE